MKRYRRILLFLGTAGTTTAAFHKARALAKASGAELRIHLHIDPRATDAISHVSRSLSGMMQSSLLFHYRDWLEEVLFDLRDYGISASGDVHWEGHDARSILRNAFSWRPDIFMKDAAAMSLLHAILPTSLDHDLLRLCPFPFYLVHGTEDSLPLNVAIAVDPSRKIHTQGSLNQRAILAGLGYSSIVDAKFSLLSVFDRDADRSISSAEEYESRRVSHKSWLATLGERFGVPGDDIHVCYGDATQCITRSIRDLGIQLLVTGSLCRNGLSHLLSHSVASTLLQDLRCDLLAVKPAGYEATFSGDIVQPLQLPTHRHRP